MTTATEKRKLTPPEIARQYGVSPDKVLIWIRSGALRAIDASATAGERPRYLVDVEDLEAFERSRQVVPPDPIHRHCKRPATPPGFVRHFRQEP